MSSNTLDAIAKVDVLTDANDGKASTLDLKTLRARVRDEGLAQPRPWRNLAHMAAEVVIYAGLVAVAYRVDSLWLWAPVWLALGFVLLGPGGIMHETIHGHLFRSVWANKLAGTLSGALLLFPWGTFRAYHIEHHASTATKDDPEGVPVAFGSRLELCLLPLGGLYTLGQLGWYTVRTLVGRPPRWIRTRVQKRDVWLSTAAVAAAVALVVVGLGTVPDLVVRVWLVPYAVALFVSYPLIFLPEHAYGAPGDTLDHTRTTVSNRFLSWIYWNNNFHAVHHLIPTAVHQHIRDLSDDIHPYQTDQWWIPGYCRFTWSLWRSLPGFPSRRRTEDVIDLTDR